MTTGRLAAFGRTPRFGPLPSPGTGEHSREVLRRAGVSEADIDELIDSGVVVAGDRMPQSLPNAYR